MNTILVIGANGGIGSIVTKQLKESDDFTPVAMIRKKNQKSYFDDIGVETIHANLSQNVDQLSKHFSKFDGVLFTAGSGGSTGYDKTLEIDLDGAVKSIEAAEESGVKRFILVSVARADDREAWDKSPIKPYMIAKHYADRALKQSNLDYTIIRPGSLTDDEGTGKITTDIESASTNNIPREVFIGIFNFIGHGGVDCHLLDESL